MTLARNGNAFSTFLRSLFVAMKNGKTMPMAWVEMAPQILSDSPLGRQKG